MKPILGLFVTAGAALAALAFSFGCAASPSSPEGVDRNAVPYSPLPTDAELNNALIADVTLIDVDEATARTLIDLGEPADTSPRILTEPQVKALAELVANDFARDIPAGRRLQLDWLFGYDPSARVLDQFRVALAAGKSADICSGYDFNWVASYQSWGFEYAPMTDAYARRWVGVKGTLELLTQDSDIYGLMLGGHSTRVAGLTESFQSVFGGTVFLGRAPRFVTEQHTATVEVKLGQTVAFLPNSRKAANSVVRLLLVRLDRL